MIVFYALAVIACWWSIRWLERPRYTDLFTSPVYREVQAQLMEEERSWSEESYLEHGTVSLRPGYRKDQIDEGADRE